MIRDQPMPNDSRTAVTTAASSHTETETTECLGTDGG